MTTESTDNTDAKIVTYETDDSVVYEFIHPKTQPQEPTSEPTGAEKVAREPKEAKKEAKKAPGPSEEITREFFVAVKAGNIPAATDLYNQAVRMGINHLVHIEEPIAGWTALHFAAARGDHPMVQFLLDRHAFVNAQTIKDDHTPLSLAVRHGCSKKLPDSYKTTIALLLDHRALPFLPDKHGLPPQAFATTHDAELGCVLIHTIGKDEPAPIIPSDPDVIAKMVNWFSTLM